MTTLKNSYSHTYATTQRATIDLSLSENPLGPSPKATEAIIVLLANHTYILMRKKR